MYSSKKAEMGVGTLIIFIAMLLVAAVAAGVLIQTAGSLQEQSLATGQQARAQISTNARVIEVSATNGQNGNLTDFEEIMKLSPGSDPMKLTQIIFTMNTKDETSTLKYKGTDGICEKNNTIGYNTWNAEVVASAITESGVRLDEDLDDDGSDDFIRLINSTDPYLLALNLSTEGDYTVNLSVNVSAVPAAGQAVSVSSTAISNGTHTLAYVTVSGTMTANNTLAANMVTVTPYKEGEGYFTVVYEQEGTNHVPGNLQRGDVIRICFEGPGQIAEDQLVRLNFIPKIGTATLTQFVTPDVISTERVYLYP